MSASVPYVIDGGWLTINGIRIAIDLPGGTHDRRDELFMGKGVGQIEAFRQLAETSGCPQALVEIGVARGGSVVFLNELLRAPRMLCIEVDLRPVPQLAAYLSLKPDIHVHLGVNQADREKVLALARDFGPFDWVIDDASHKYVETRTAFETLFPLLAPGGLYIIEDWPWSHTAAAQRADHYLTGESALTNLLFDLIIAHGTYAHAFSEIYSGTGFFWIKRGPGELPTDGSMRLNAYRGLRGKTLGVI